MSVRVCACVCVRVCARACLLACLSVCASVAVRWVRVSESGFERVWYTVRVRASVWANVLHEQKKQGGCISHPVQ